MKKVLISGFRITAMKAMYVVFIAVLLTGCDVENFGALQDWLEQQGEPVMPPCECPFDSLHYVNDPDFVQAWLSFDFEPDSVEWHVGPYSWTGTDDLVGTDLLALVSIVWPQITWKIFPGSDGLALYGKGTNDTDIFHNNVWGRPMINGNYGQKFYPSWDWQTITHGGYLSFNETKSLLMEFKSVRNMNLRGMVITEEQATELWDLAIQYCSCRLATPDNRLDFRHGPFTQETVTQATNRGWWCIVP